MLVWRMVPSVRLERTTYCFEGNYSIQLSYEGSCMVAARGIEPHPYGKVLMRHPTGPPVNRCIMVANQGIEPCTSVCKTDVFTYKLVCYMVAHKGIEPFFTEYKSDVLPLDE